MRKVLKKSLAILLSLMMTVSVVSAAAIVSADTDYTMTAIVAMKPQDGDELLATRHIFNLTEEQLTALNGGNAVDLATYGFEARMGHRSCHLGGSHRISRRKLGSKPLGI